MICLKNGQRGSGQHERDLRTVELARRRDHHIAVWANAEAAYEAEISKARPGRYGKRSTDYPTAVRAAIAVWDREVGN